MTPPSARRPGPRPSVPEVAPEEFLLLQRLQRLRVLTSFQAHGLVDHFHATNPETQKPRTERNTRMRLQRMVEEGFLKAAPAQPEKGGYSGFYYRLGGKGLRTLGIPEDKNLLRRPPVPVLRYLLLRNELYARARLAGWDVLSPLLFPEALHESLLARVREWIHLRLEERVTRGEGGARAALERLPELMSPRLSFDCLMRHDAATKRPSALVLVVVDDVRRAIAPTTRKADPTSLAPAQCGELPPLLPDAGLLLRDTDSRWNTTTRTLEVESPRLRQWRRLLASRYGKGLLDTDTLFPEVWAQRIHSPRSDGSRASSPDAEGEE